MGKLQLRPGDILLYHPVAFSCKNAAGWLFGHIIAVKTWHFVSHVEIYDGVYHSWASRDGKGFGNYPLRLTELAYILRPTLPLDLAKARRWATTQIGVPYGWLDLLNFIGAPVDRRGMVCSPAAAGFLRAAGWGVFPADPINKIAPFQFLDLVGNECAIAYGPETLAGIAKNC